LIGAVLGFISSSILLPALQQLHLRREVKVTMLVEASFGDALAVLAVTTRLDIAAGGRRSKSDCVGSGLSSDTGSG
jgi:potassium/hydrogen antiporter